MWSILGWVTGLAGPLTSLAAKYIDLLKARSDAKTNIEKAKIDQQIEDLHDKRAVLVAEVGNRFTSIILGISQGLIFIPVGLYIFKILAWDKVIGSLVSKDFFTTSPVDTMMWTTVIAAVVGLLTVSIIRK